jgi:hypothetical protein
MRFIALTVTSFAIIYALAGVAGAARTDAAADVRNLVAEVEQRHPNPYHAVSHAEFHAAAEDLARRAPSQTRNQLIVGVMRLMALLGERDGHSGLFPIQAAHARTLNAYPLRLYRFPEGLFVIRALDASLVGSRIVALGGIPAEEVEALVRPLVPRDNEWSRLGNLPYYLVVAEVLDGLGIAPVWELELRDGTRRSVALQPIPVGTWITSLGASWWQSVRRPPLYVRLSHSRYGLTKIDRGRVLYVSYNQTTDPGLIPQRLVRLARNKRVRRIVVDIRLNGGGDNTSYYRFIQALRHPRVNRPGRLAVLIGRGTFSAAGNFAAEVDGATRARFFGEPTGGAPSQWGDHAPIPLPSLSVNAGTAAEYVGDLDDTRTATLPNVAGATTAADFFAGGDPVLAAALR